MRIAALAVAALLAGAAGPAPGEAIVTYCGGGATGGGGGLQLTPDGSVTRLRRPRAGAPVEETLLDGRSAPYARIAAMLEAAGFAGLPRGAPSNMTCSIAWRRHGASHQVMWGIGQAPAALRPALAEIEAAGR
ncbi:hypothetical protein [Roseomonas fluvialis]|uniref:Uncharacterized protein n=1 Tax=Roseomonas fluvialis TaxID=1750527 RepID=A0ABM7Y4H1_9PROT|nr:hypothetical protein [Roseomonas fluvialis]BDG72778.1 hypothetical protein Rmf_27070 [Roseomonas fluvialis]